MLRHEDKAAALAYYNAALAAEIIGDAELPSEGWPMLSLRASVGLAESAERFVAQTLAPFVRANPDAPPEALYRQAHAAGVHSGDVDGWAALPLALRFAYGLFGMTLVYADRELKAAAPAKADPVRAARRRASQAELGDALSERTLGERVDDDGVLDREDDLNTRGDGTVRPRQMGHGQRARRAREGSPAASSSVRPDAAEKAATTQEAGMPSGNSLEDMKQAVLAQNSTDLRAKDPATGRPMQTLAERTAREGVRAQLDTGVKKLPAELRKAARTTRGDKKPAKKVKAAAKAAAAKKPTLAQRNRASKRKSGARRPTR